MWLTKFYWASCHWTTAHPPPLFRLGIAISEKYSQEVAFYSGISQKRVYVFYSGIWFKYITQLSSSDFSSRSKLVEKSEDYVYIYFCLKSNFWLQSLNAYNECCSLLIANFSINAYLVASKSSSFDNFCDAYPFVPIALLIKCYFSFTHHMWLFSNAHFSI